MLPLHGVAFSVFLLANSARYTAHPSMTAWVNAARSKSSYMAVAADLERPAAELLRLRLASRERGITLAPQLLALAERGDRETLVGVAQLLLTHAPPVWLHLAVSATDVFREYIPQADLQGLEWLEPDLDDVLRNSFAAVPASHDNAALQQQIGDAAELFLMTAFTRAGMRPLHVSRLSDAYGYDIEITSGEGGARFVDRVEVKSAGPRTRGSFHLTRNEFEKSCAYGSQWRLLQVVFRSSAFVAARLDDSHIEGIYELSSAALAEVVPPDTPEFRWTESAFFTPRAARWQVAAQVPLECGFSMPGFMQTADPPNLSNAAANSLRQ
jgi:hypothetical protein